MFGSTDIYNALNVSAITTGLDNYVVGETTYKALFDAVILPQDFTGQKSINFYMLTPRNFGLDYEIYRYIVNCRAATYNESRTIAQNVLNEINRESYTDYYIVCSLVPTIKPVDDTDNYNTPIEIILKKR